jgi:ferredoxin
MASITIHIPVGSTGEGRRVDLRPAFSVLNSLLAAGVAIPHDCGGKALCGTCRIRIREGGAGLSAKTGLEASRLAAVGAGPEERLACQTHCLRDIVIEIVGRKREEGT